jgi:pyruvate formate lyase activating enzyme
MPDQTTPQADTARILEIQRMSTEDGPGIRTTVFFKGCNLKCTWCHNPESISPRPQIQWIDSRCIGCRTCLAACPRQALLLTENGLAINRDLCDGCGVCAEECPATALELLGTTWTLTDLVREVEKDRSYYDSSGGGVTVSGGEPVLQSRFVARFLEKLKQDGIHTAVDTCGGYQPRLLTELLPFTDLILFDLKEIDPGKHQKFTGFPLEKVLDTFFSLCDCLKETASDCEIWIRTPIIPGTTDRPDNIDGIGRLLTDRANGRVRRWELCAFNHLCRDKYRRLDMSWAFSDCRPLPAEKMETLAGVARKSGVAPAIVHWSGTTRDE